MPPRQPGHGRVTRLMARVLIVALVFALVPIPAAASIPDLGPTAKASVVFIALNVRGASGLTKTAFGELIAHTGTASAGQAPRLESPEGEASFRIGKLWAPKRDVWWELVPKPPVGAGVFDYMRRTPLPDAMLKVGGAVEDAVGKVRDYGIPFFNDVRESHERLR